MKTKILILTLLSGFIFSLSAQQYTPQIGYSVEPGYKTNFKKNRAGDNWFISAGAGMGVLFGDQNNEADFKDRLNANPHFAFGKWFNPYFGMRAYFTGGNLHGFEGNNAQFMQHNRFFAGHLDFMYDVTNHWGVYNFKRFFRFIPWIGLGYAQKFKNKYPQEFLGKAESPSLNLGILTAFRLSDRVDFNLELQDMLLNEEFNRVSGGKLCDGIAQLSTGLTFKLGKTDFEVIKPMDYGLINDLNNRINALRAENDQLSRRPVSCPDCPDVPPANVVNHYGENFVRFRLDSHKIDENQEVNIYNAAQFVKETGTRLTVVGYADRNTGTAAYNMQLSEKRAKAVAKQLTDKYGIPASQITIDWKGSDVQPFEVNNWNRVVIMTGDKNNIR